MRTPTRRRTKSGKTRWQARVDAKGKRVSLGTFASKKEAQAAIAQHELKVGAPAPTTTVREYAGVWLERHPRGESTHDTHEQKVNSVLGLEVDDKPLGDYVYSEFRKTHAKQLLAVLMDNDHNKGGIMAIVRSLSAMTTDAVEDEVVEYNAFSKLTKVISRMPAEEAEPRRIFPIEDLKKFAHCSPDPAHVMTYVLTGMRLQEAFTLTHADLDAKNGMVRVEDHAYKRKVVKKTKSRSKADSERWTVCPPELLAMIRKGPAHISGLLFPNDQGRVWDKAAFYRNIWTPTVEAADIDPTPHECKHSWISHMVASGVSIDDVSEMAGTKPETIFRVYLHSTGQSIEKAKAALG